MKRRLSVDTRQREQHLLSSQMCDDILLARRFVFSDRRPVFDDSSLKTFSRHS